MVRNKWHQKSSGQDISSEEFQPKGHQRAHDNETYITGSIRLEMIKFNVREIIFKIEDESFLKRE